MMESSSTGATTNAAMQGISEFQPVPLFSTEDFFREDSIVKAAKK